MQALTLPATLESLPRLANFAYQAALQCGLDERAAWEVQLAVDEGVTNVIQHSYADQADGLISLTCRCEADQFVVTIHDNGRPFDPESVPPPDLVSSIDERESGGLGIYLMRRLADHVSFRFDENGNELVLVKLLTKALPEDLRIIPLAGRIDAAFAPDIASQIRSAIGQGARRLVLDFTAVSFLSSSGLRTLLLLARELRQVQGEIRLCSLPPQIAEVFTLTGFDRLFPMHTSRDEATAAFLNG